MKGLWDIKHLLDGGEEINIGPYTLGKTEEYINPIYYIDKDIYDYTQGKIIRSTVDFDSDFDKFVKKVENEAEFELNEK